MNYSTTSDHLLEYLLWLTQTAHFFFWVIYLLIQHSRNYFLKWLCALNCARHWNDTQADVAFPRVLSYIKPSFSLLLPVMGTNFTLRTIQNVFQVIYIQVLNISSHLTCHFGSEWVLPLLLCFFPFTFTGGSVRKPSLMEASSVLENERDHGENHGEGTQT